MLEHASLILRRDAAPPNGEINDLKICWTISEAASGAALGVAGWARGSSRSWNWFGRRILAVHETEDAPLVFTIHRRWGLTSTWEVCDADEQILGRVAGAVVKDRFGRNLALLERPRRGPWRVRDLDGRELMTVQKGSEVVQVQFGVAAEGNPFLKMLLLAVALVR